MGYKEKRRPIRVGATSKAVILPKPWLDYHGENAETLTLFGDAVLIIAPNGYEKKAKQLLEIMEKPRIRDHEEGDPRISQLKLSEDGRLEVKEDEGIKVKKLGKQYVYLDPETKRFRVTPVE